MRALAVRSRGGRALLALLALFGLSLQAAGAFTVIPTVSRGRVLLRFIGRPPEGNPLDPAYHQGYVGLRVLRDGQTLGDVLDSPSTGTLLALRTSLYGDEEWATLVKATNDTLADLKLSPVGSAPADWVAGVKALPAVAAGLELQDWRAAVLLSRALLDVRPPPGPHTYEVVGLQASPQTRVPVPFALQNVAPLTVDPSVDTVISAPNLWNVTPGKAFEGLVNRKATVGVPEGDPAPTVKVTVFSEKAHNTVYLKIGPPFFLALPGTTPPARVLPFGYDIERAPVSLMAPNTPPAADSPAWQRINAHPVAVVETPAEVPAEPPPAVLEALKAEIPHEPGSVDEAALTAQAKAHWNASRTRPSAATFRNKDFDFADRGTGLLGPGETEPKLTVWGPKLFYWYRLRGLNGFGVPGDPSPPIKCRPYEVHRPMPPRNLVARKSGANQVHLEWEPSLPPPAGVDPAPWKPAAAYRVYRWVNSPGYPNHPVDPVTNPSGPGDLVAVLPAGTLSLDDTGQKVGLPPVALAEGTTYWYRVVAADDSDPANESLPSGPAWALLYDETAPGPPAGIQIAGRPCIPDKRNGGSTEQPPLTNVPGTTDGRTLTPVECECEVLKATPIRPLSDLAPGKTGSALLSWAPSPDPDVVGYLVYRAPAQRDVGQDCPVRPGPLEFVAEVRGTSFVDPYLPTDATPVFYAIRAMDKDRNLSPPLFYPAPVVLSGTQPLPEPGFVKAESVGPATPPGPWKVELQWDASIPQGTFYQWELWRAEKKMEADTALPGGLDPEANLTLLGHGTTGVPSTFPAKYDDAAVAPGPDNLPTDYWYMVVLKDPSGVNPPARSKAQYVKVGGDVTEPEHPIRLFPWHDTNPVEVVSTATGKQVQLRWREFPFVHLRWVKAGATRASVLAAEGLASGDKDPSIQERSPVEYVVFRSATSPTGNFRQVSPILRTWFYSDADVHPDRVYYYQILAFDPVTQELVGYTPVQTASLLTVTPVDPPVIELPEPNVKFLFNLADGETVTFPLSLGPLTTQSFAATGEGTIALTVARTAGTPPETALSAVKTAALPFTLTMGVPPGAATHELRVRAVGGPAQGKVVRTGSGAVIIPLPEALQNLRAAKLGVKVPIPQPDGTLVDVQKGDLNQDTRVNVGDVLVAIKGILKMTPLTDLQSASADANGDATVNIGDVIQILRFAVGM